MTVSVTLWSACLRVVVALNKPPTLDHTVASRLYFSVNGEVADEETVAVVVVVLPLVSLGAAQLRLFFQSYFTRDGLCNKLFHIRNELNLSARRALPGRDIQVAHLGRRARHLVALSTFFDSCEIKPAIKDKPYTVSYGHAFQARRNEDFVVAKTKCQRVPGDHGSSTYDAFAILDGHNGTAAAVFTEENLLNNVTSAVPSGLSRDEWLAALPRAMVAGFVKTDKDWQKRGTPYGTLRGKFSGTTATLVIVDGLTVTAACVGDSRCILDAEGTVIALTIDHRLETNEEERERVVASGGQVARLHPYGGREVGPLRAWPGGICLSRSIGDLDAGEYIVPVPHVKQIKLSPGGGRLIIASDGVWDALSSEKVAKVCRGEKQPEIAAKNVVKEAVRIQGLRDDTTCLVVDIVPPGRASRFFAPAIRKQLTLMKFLRFSRSKNKGVTQAPAMEELFEETSATLAERLGPVP